MTADQLSLYLTITGAVSQAIGVVLVVIDIQSSRRIMDLEDPKATKRLRGLLERLRFRKAQPEDATVIATAGSAHVVGGTATVSVTTHPRSLQGVIDDLQSLKASTNERFQAVERSLGEQGSRLRREIQEVRNELLEGLEGITERSKTLTVERIRVQWWTLVFLLGGVALSGLAAPIVRMVAG